MESTVPNSPDSFADKANELVMSFDLTVDEARRRAAVLQAIGAHWDPAVALANEHARPHAPQLAGVVRRSASQPLAALPSQSAKPVGQV